MNPNNSIDSKNGYIYAMIAITMFLLLMNIVISLGDINRFSDYVAYPVSDYLINYQGGFVRRGLMGEVFYQIYNMHPYHLYIVVIYLNIAIFIVFMLLMLRMYNKMKWLPVFPFVFIVGKITFYRRDFMMILLSFFVFHYLFRYFKEHKSSCFVLSVIIMLLSILVYEPSFFFIVPVAILLFFSNTQQYSLNRKFFSTFKAFVIPLIAMVLVCHFNGDEQVEYSIYRSWIPLFEWEGVKTQMNDIMGVSFLSSSTTGIMMQHFKMNFYGIHGQNMDLSLVLGFTLFIIGFYYLTVWIPKKQHVDTLRLLLSDIFIIQFICLIPMFTVLSCDLGRTVLYLSFTTLIIVYMMSINKMSIRIPIVQSISNSIISHTESVRFLHSFWFYLLIILFVPFKRAAGVPLTHNFLQEYLDMFEPLKTFIINLIK